MMKKTILISLLLMFTITSCSNRESVSELEIKYNRAISLNDTQTAIQYLHEILDKEPNNNSVYTRLSDLYLDTENYEGVIKVSDFASKKSNKNELKDVLYAKSEAYKKLGKPLKSIEVLDSLSAINPELIVKYNYDKGVLFFEGKLYDKSLSLMSAVIEDTNSRGINKIVNSTYGEELVNYKWAALNFTGSIYLTQGDYEKSKTYYQRILNETQSFKLANNNYIILTQKQLELANKK